MAWTEAARAGAFVTLVAASALVLLLFPAPAAVDRVYVLGPILALFVALLLGCAAVLLSPASAAPARAILAVQWRAATARELRWVGFTAVVFCAGHVLRAVVREEPAAAAEEVWTDKVGAVAILFLVFLAGVWTVNLSVLTRRVGSTALLYERSTRPSPRSSSPLPPRRRIRNAMAWTEAAVRRAGAFVTLAAASALVLLLFPAPAAVDRGYVLVPILALFVALLLGCAAVLLSPAAAAPARAILAAQWHAATARELRWVGFTAVVFYAGHVVRAVMREEPAAAAVSTGKVGSVAILFLVFLAGVWSVNLSVLTRRVGSRPVLLPPPPLQAPDEELDCA